MNHVLDNEPRNRRAQKGAFITWKGVTLAGHWRKKRRENPDFRWWRGDERSRGERCSVKWVLLEIPAKEISEQRMAWSNRYSIYNGKMRLSEVGVNGICVHFDSCMILLSDARPDTRKNSRAIGQGQWCKNRNAGGRYRMHVTNIVAFWNPAVRYLSNLRACGAASSLCDGSLFIHNELSYDLMSFSEWNCLKKMTCIWFILSTREFINRSI